MVAPDPSPAPRRPPERKGPPMSCQMTSSAFDWDAGTPERFRFAGLRYDVQTAKRIIADSPREVVTLDITCLREFHPLIRLHDPHRPVDLAFPLIVAANHHGHMIIDGWHRIKEALHDGLDALPAVVLTARESERARCCGPGEEGPSGVYARSVIEAFLYGSIRAAVTRAAGAALAVLVGMAEAHLHATLDADTAARECRADDPGAWERVYGELERSVMAGAAMRTVLDAIRNLLDVLRPPA